MTKMLAIPPRVCLRFLHISFTQHLAPASQKISLSLGITVFLKNTAACAAAIYQGVGRALADHGHDHHPGHSQYSTRLSSSYFPQLNLGVAAPVWANFGDEFRRAMVNYSGFYFRGRKKITIINDLTRH